MIPFSPPRIDEKICNAVVETLKSGWITTGPKTKLFEKKISEYCNVPNTLCLNSATAGLETMLRWFGVKPGDEVIIPAYTYSATANVVIHCGAKPVMVDVNPNDFNISVKEIEKHITEKTKVIIPVDFAGFPADYDEIMQLVESKKNLFRPENQIQEMLGRIMVLSDAAHSFGAFYKGKRTGSLCDATVFSFHAVKNLTTAEGGAIALNLPKPFDNEKIYQYLCIHILHGQNKDALAKMQKGNWKYDIIEAGYKYNMTDILATIGLVELERYDNDTLKKRKQIFDFYSKELATIKTIELPIYETKEKISSYHVYPLRIKGITESQRDAIIQEIFNQDVSVNVHFIPLPMMSFYKSLGYDIKNYPVAYDNYSREISLPVFYDLSYEQMKTVVSAVKSAIQTVLGK
ncbi:MAG: aminotransferase [Bacteroidia bacterium]|nr:MAG: aminotransferase [Bacteroidia bacterium]